MATAVALNLPASDTAPYGGWPTKTLAAVALKALRERGLNCDPDITIHPAVRPLGRFWVIARTDHPLREWTYLMCADGTWLRGRVFDGWDIATWRAFPAADGVPIPATVTHVTRTAPYHGRQERYRTKSNGSGGRWVQSDESVALCTCPWRAYADSREEARRLARVHRDSTA